MDDRNRTTPERATTTIHETHVREERGSSKFAFILGGVVVALAIIGFIVYGGDSDPAPVSGGDTNVNVEAPLADAPAADASPVDVPAPTTEEAAPAPAGN